MLSFKRLGQHAVFVFFSVTPACISGDSEPEHLSIDTNHEPDCINCELQRTIPNLHLPTLSQLKILPNELMFYGELTEQTPIAEQSFSIVNQTSLNVMISRYQILDDPNALGAEGSYEYFTLSSFTPNTWLAPGESLTLSVLFQPSVQQKSALLMISTSHPSFSTLSLKLSGKYFFE